MGYTTNDIGCCCTPCNCGTCGTCLIPLQDMTIAWTNPILGDGSAALVYNGSAWISACTNQLLFELQCATGVPVLSITYYLSGSCPTGQAQTAATNKSNPLKIIEDSLTCASGGTPFSLTAHVTSASNPNLLAFGYTSFTVTGPTMPAAPLMCATFCCTGAGAGSTVSIYASSGGTLLGSGTTLSNGCATLYWTGTAGDYYVTLAGARDTSGTFAVACNATVQICFCPTLATVYVTDTSTTTACQFKTALGYWVGCYNLSTTPSTDPCACLNQTGPAGSACTIIYNVRCSGSGQISITRIWKTCSSGTYCAYCADVVDANCNPVGQTCGESHGAVCGYAGMDLTATPSNPTSDSPLAGSLSLVLGSFGGSGDNCAPLNSPLGAGVSYSS